MDYAEAPVRRPVALVTGAATGIGHACALQLSQHYAVWVGFNSHAADAYALVETIQQAGGEAYAVHINYTDTQTIRSAFEQFVQNYSEQERSPELSVLVTNAGTFGSGYRMLLELDEPEWDQVWNVNVTGACQMLRQFASLLIPQSLVVNISSMVAHLGAIGYKSQAHYCVTKSVMNHFLHALQQTEGWQHIRIVNLLPGLINTGLLHDHLGPDFATYTRAIPLGELASPAVIADALAFLASPDGSALDAIDLVIDGGWSQKGWSRYA